MHLDNPRRSVKSRPYLGVNTVGDAYPVLFGDDVHEQKLVSCGYLCIRKPSRSVLRNKVQNELVLCRCSLALRGHFVVVFLSKWWTHMFLNSCNVSNNSSHKMLYVALKRISSFQSSASLFWFSVFTPSYLSISLLDLFLCFRIL